MSTSSKKWEFVRKIWQNPPDTNCRLVYRDWLLENGHLRAANRQLHAIHLIDNAIEIWYSKRVSYIVGFTLANKRGSTITWRMKRNSEIMRYPKNIQLRNLYLPNFHLLIRRTK